MPNTNAFLERLHAVFLETFHIDVPSADADLLENGILDSFQLVELLLQLERHFGMRIAIENIDLEDLRTLGRMARLLVANSGAVDAPQHSRPETRPGEARPAPGD